MNYQLGINLFEPGYTSTEGKSFDRNHKTLQTYALDKEV